MMTIKHKTDTNEEFVYATSHVNFVPSSAKNCGPSHDSLWRYDNDGRAHEITAGTVFVMNEHGKTVARYDLGEVEDPDRAKPRLGLQPVALS